MSDVELSLLAGSILSLLFSYFPGLRTWFESKLPERKRLIMLGVVALVAVAIFGLSCAGFAAELRLNLTCDRAGGIGLIQSVILVAVANQGTFMLTKRS